MDRDELNKAAEEYAHENAWYPGETSYESDINAMQESFSDTFKRGADWLMQQPLSERLTDEEKEKILQVYRQASYPSNRCTFTGQCVLRLFPCIFGKDLFNQPTAI